MKNEEKRFTPLKPFERLLHLFKAILLFFIIAAELLYGFSLTTNILTQFNHTDTWFYVSIFITCYSIMALFFALLYKMISKHILSAASGLRIVEQI